MGFDGEKWLLCPIRFTGICRQCLYGVYYLQVFTLFDALRASSLMGGVVVCIGYSPMYLRELYEAAYTLVLYFYDKDLCLFFEN